MNVLLPDEVSKLREAWTGNAGVRATARKLNINRETVARYFRTWDSEAAPFVEAPKIDLSSWLAKMTRENDELIVMIAAHLGKPHVFGLIEAAAKKFASDADDLKRLRLAVAMRNPAGTNA